VDNVAHTLAGLALARAGFERRTAGATTALVIASNLPDADIVFGAFGPAAYLDHHRGLSHSLFVAPFLALALAAVLRLFFREARWLWLWLASVTGIAGHIFMDLWTSYGTRALLPFDHTWYAWDVVFIIDPIVWALLLGALLLARRPPLRGQVAAVGLGLVLAYVGARAALHARALDLAQDRLPSSGVTRVAALPTLRSPLRWRLLADAGDSFYIGDIDLRRPAPPLRRREKRPEDAAVTRVRETSEAAAIFLDFSRFPWLEVADTPDGRAVSWSDLRFEDTSGSKGAGGTPPPRRHFVAQVVLGPDGRIRSQSIRF